MPAMLTAAAIMIIFAVMAAMMYSNRLPALLALPIMAVAIAAAAGLPARDLIQGVLSDGALRLHATYTAVIFGAILAKFIDKTGIAESLIKRAAELAGDRPVAVSLVVTAAVALLFTVLGGLGAVIMIATIVFPVMLSIGLPPLAAGALFLFGLSLGGIFNPVNWQLYVDVLKLNPQDVIGFSMLLGAAFAVLIIAFIAVETRYRRSFWAVDLLSGKERTIDLPAAAYLTPVVPVVLLLGFSLYNRLAAPATAFDFPVIPAMMAGILYGVLALGLRRRGAWPLFCLLTLAAAVLALTAPAQIFIGSLLISRTAAVAFILLGALAVALTGWNKEAGMANAVSRSVIEGIGDVAPAVALMIGIGMLLSAVAHPQVSGIIGPLVERVMPSGPLGYVLFFALLAPLALWRGPFNLYGMGAGLAGLMLASGKLPAVALMAAIASVGQLQGVCDPTNTHNVWIANYLGCDTMTILKKTMPYIWLLALAGLIIAGIIYF